MSFKVKATKKGVHFSIDQQGFDLLVLKDPEVSDLKRHQWYAGQLRVALGRLEGSGTMSAAETEVERLTDLLATASDMLGWASGAFEVAGYRPMWDHVGKGFLEQLEREDLKGKGSMRHGVSLGVFRKPFVLGE